MRLTKSKISKLLKCNNQTLKKITGKKNSYYRSSFRKKKYNNNIRNKTLKSNYYKTNKQYGGNNSIQELEALKYNINQIRISYLLDDDISNENINDYNHSENSVDYKVNLQYSTNPRCDENKNSIHAVKLVNNTEQNIEGLVHSINIDHNNPLYKTYPFNSNDCNDNYDKFVKFNHKLFPPVPPFYDDLLNLEFNYNDDDNTIDKTKPNDDDNNILSDKSNTKILANTEEERELAKERRDELDTETPQTKEDISENAETILKPKILANTKEERESAEEKRKLEKKKKTRRKRIRYRNTKNTSKYKRRDRISKRKKKIRRRREKINYIRFRKTD